MAPARPTALRRVSPNDRCEPADPTPEANEDVSLPLGVAAVWWPRPIRPTVVRINPPGALAEYLGEENAPSPKNVPLWTYGYQHHIQRNRFNSHMNTTTVSKFVIAFAYAAVELLKVRLVSSG